MNINNISVWVKDNTIHTEKFGEIQPKVLYISPIGDDYWKCTTAFVCPKYTMKKGILWYAIVRTYIEESTTGNICSTIENAVNNALKKHSKKYGYKFEKYKSDF